MPGILLCLGSEEEEDMRSDVESIELGGEMEV